MKNSNGIKIGILIILAMVILPAVLVVAAEGDYTVLAPLPGTTEGVCDPGLPPPNPNCQTTLKDYIPALFNLLIGLAAVAAVLNIVIGGFQYISTDAIMKKESGKKRIQNAVFSLVLIISAWLILYTINPNLLHINLNIDSVTTTSPLGAGGTLTGGRVATGADLLVGDSFQADLAVRNQLGNVEVNNPPCTAGRTSNCTNLNGLPPSMVSYLKTLQTACAQNNNGSCQVKITGGTETSLHTTGTAHGPGNSVVDLTPSESLNKYLAFPYPKSGDIKTIGGLTFKYEAAGDSGGVSTGAHWHVTK